MKNNKKIYFDIFLKGFLGLSLFLLSLGFIGVTSAKAVDSSIIDYWNFNTLNRFSVLNNVDFGYNGQPNFVAGKWPGEGQNGYSIATYPGVLYQTFSSAKTLNDGVTFSFWSRSRNVGEESKINQAVLWNTDSSAFFVATFSIYNGLSTYLPPTGNGCASVTNTFRDIAYATAYNGQYHHYAIVITEFQTAIYYDNQIVYSCTFNNQATISELKKLSFDANNFPVYLDDVIIFNKAISQSELDLVYTTESQNINFTPPSLPACISYTYTAWSLCGRNPNYPSNQDRNIATKTPSNCDIYNASSTPYDSLFRLCSGAPKIQLPYSWKGILYGDSTYQRLKYLYSATEIASTDYITMYKCSNAQCTGTSTQMTFNNGNIATTTLNVLNPFGVPDESYSTGISMFIIPEPTDIGTTTTQVLTYKFFLYQGEAGNQTSTQAEIRSITWLTEQDYYNSMGYEDVIPYQECDMPSYELSTICAGIPSSVLGDFQCGFKYGLVVSAQFIFYPSCDSLNSITKNYNSFRHSFPFNAYFDFTGSINKAINTALVTSKPQSLNIPFIRKTATSYEYYMMPVMSSSSFTNTIGSANYSTLKMTLAFIYWLIAAAIVFLIVTKL